MTGYGSVLLTLWAVDFVALVSPGPNFVLVTQTAARRSRVNAVATATGVAIGSLVWGAAVACGLAALFGVVPWLHAAVRIVGGCYLIYLGAQMWRAREHLPVPAVRDARSGALLRGLWTNLLNPKSAAYYGSVFALFFPPATPVWVQITGVALISATSWAWHVGLALLFSTGPARQLYLRLRRVIDRVAGGVMAVLGIRLLAQD